MTTASKSIASDARRVIVTVSEDWLSVIVGLAIFGLGLMSVLSADLLGWTVATSVWIDPSQALSTVSKAYVGFGGLGALLATYAALAVVLSLAAAAVGHDVRRFAIAFTAVFFLGYAS